MLPSYTNTTNNTGGTLNLFKLCFESIYSPTRRNNNYILCLSSEVNLCKCELTIT